MNEVNEQVGLDISFEDAALRRLSASFYEELNTYNLLLSLLEERLNVLSPISNTEPFSETKAIPNAHEGYVEELQRSIESFQRFNKKLETMIVHFKTII